LTRDSFNLKGTPATVTVAALNAKNRKQDTLPLMLRLAEALRSKFKSVPGFPKTRAFPNMPWGTAGAKMIHPDLAAAEIECAEKDEQGKKVKHGWVRDFHMLRHTFITSLSENGVHPKVAQDLARHSDINLTMSYYTHLQIDARAKALDALPDLTIAPAKDAPEKAQGTGT
jgi:integrase